MSPAGLAAFLGWAAAYALAATAIVAPVSGAALGVPLRRAAMVALPTLFFVFLSQHPFPSPAALDCPVAAGTPRLRPFALVGLFADAYGRRGDPVTWLLEVGPASTIMNLAVCVVIGLALARTGAGVRAAALFAALLSLTIELTQITGIWGLYPCAYRQFDVDDLILNVAGVALGAWLARRRAAQPS